VTALLPRNIAFVVIISGTKRLVGVVRDTQVSCLTYDGPATQL
jgi:hypothetical protein